MAIAVRSLPSIRYVALGAVFQVLTGCSVAGAEPVKMSLSAICHCPGGAYYARTRHFTAFETIEDCLGSGGRHPKKGQGDCEAPVAGTGEAAAPPLSTPITGQFTQPYDRAAFGDWADFSGNCRNTRHELLAELSTGNIETTPDGCEIIHGRWNDPYTGRPDRRHWVKCSAYFLGKVLGTMRRRQVCFILVDSPCCPRDVCFLQMRT